MTTPHSASILFHNAYFFLTKVYGYLSFTLQWYWSQQVNLQIYTKMLLFWEPHIFSHDAYLSKNSYHHLFIMVIVPLFPLIIKKLHKFTTSSYHFWLHSKLTRFKIVQVQPNSTFLRMTTNDMEETIGGSNFDAYRSMLHKSAAKVLQKVYTTITFLRRPRIKGKSPVM